MHKYFKPNCCFKWIKWSKWIKSAVALSLMLITGCSSHNDETKLEADMVILTQKMQALNAELMALKAKQIKERQLKIQQSKLGAANQS